jgi:exopolysaccharide biosynthesis polyprenyl glycosylphosphotransferase
MASSLRKNFPTLVSAVLVASDVAAIFLSVVFCYWLRFFSPLVRFFPITKGIPPLSWYLYGAIFVAFVWIVIFARHGMYRSRREVSLFEEAYQVFQGISLGFVVVLASSFFLRGETSFSRLVLVMVWIVSVFSTTFLRRLARLWELWVLKRGHGVKKVIILGQGEQAQRVYRSLRRSPNSGYEIIGSFTEDAGLPPLGPRCPQLGKIEEMNGLAAALKPQLVMVALPSQYNPWVLEFVLEYPDINVEFQLVPDLLGMIASRAEVAQLEGLPLISVGKIPLDGWGAILKRGVDMAFSAVGLALLSPAMLILAILVKATSRGPVIYSQERTSVNGKRFRLHKFRSMEVDAEAKTGPVFATENDSRSTSIGAFLRRRHLDELPQLVNVLKGEMSLVGPRPERPYFVEKFKKEYPLYFCRHKVKSGITGWAQVNQLYGDTSIAERTKYDLYYIENWSPFLDLRILFLTLKDIFSSKNSH